MKFCRLLLLVLFIQGLFAVADPEEVVMSQSSSLGALSKDFKSSISLKNVTNQVFVVTHVELPARLLFYEAATIPKVGTVIKKDESFYIALPLKKGSELQFSQGDIFVLESKDKRVISISLTLELCQRSSTKLSVSSKEFHLPMQDAFGNDWSHTGGLIRD